MSVTLEDIALEAGYPLITISQTLNDCNDVGEDAKQLIKCVAQEMDCHPHAIAQCLRRRHTNPVSFIVPVTDAGLRHVLGHT